MEILFKAKRLDGGGWVEGYLWSARTIGYSSPCGHVDEVVVDPSTICQYTGLTDKNGVKIFEGDIVRKYGDYVVVFDGYRFAAKNFFNSCYDSPDDFSSEEVDKIEVCGSIHDQDGEGKECT